MELEIRLAGGVYKYWAPLELPRLVSVLAVL